LNQGHGEHDDNQHRRREGKPEVPGLQLGQTRQQQ
jgi:hypothetical protein